ncbi:GNAT family N-acetyltransferase [bacterium]|nr:GNAT family N-acetyltransferase [bacterium]
MASVPSWRLLADLPDVPGLVVRGFSSDGDFVGMARALNAASAADGSERVEDPDEMRRHYTRLDNSDIERDVAVVEIDGEIVGYGRVTWWAQYDGARRYLPFCFIDPGARGLGIGTALLTHNEARLREIAAGHSDEGERTFEVFCADTEVGADILYRSFDYEPARYEASMIRSHLDDLPEAPMPEGLVVRTPEESELRAVFEADVEAFADHIDEAPPLENAFDGFMEFEWNDPSLWRVAWDGDEVAGQVRSYINERENAQFGRKRGLTENVSVRRPYRRSGLARSLLVQSLEAVRDRGMTEAVLGVSVENLHGALALYESVGFRRFLTWTTFRKPI